MTAYADSSALVKLYVPEPGHDVVRGLTRPLIVSALARVEVPAAFWGKSRAGELEPDDARLLTAAFEYDFHGTASDEPHFLVVPVSESVLVAAAVHTARHGLRASDAVQLASAVAARQADDEVVAMAVFDKALGRAASAEGFAVTS